MERERARERGVRERERVSLWRPWMARRGEARREAATHPLTSHSTPLVAPLSRSDVLEEEALSSSCQTPLLLCRKAAECVTGTGSGCRMFPRPPSSRYIRSCRGSASPLFPRAAWGPLEDDCADFLLSSPRSARTAPLVAQPHPIALATPSPARPTMTTPAPCCLSFPREPVVRTRQCSPLKNSWSDWTLAVSEEPVARRALASSRRAPAVSSSPARGARFGALGVREDGTWQAWKGLASLALALSRLRSSR